jgi:DNA processing protein
LPYRFPERNRIVSGLCLGTLIVEAADKSGTLITARLCMEQNRELMVLPGSSFSTQYEGSHRLIQSGAYLVTNPTDVLSVLSRELAVYIAESIESHAFATKGTSSASSSSLASISSEVLLHESVSGGRSSINLHTQSILKLISREPMSTDMVIIATGLRATEASALLLRLELEGRAARTQDGRFFGVV